MCIEVYVELECTLLRHIYFESVELIEVETRASQLDLRLDVVAVAR